MPDAKTEYKKIKRASLNNRNETKRRMRGSQKTKTITKSQAPPIYDFSGMDFFSLYHSSSDFREIVKSGKYIYFDGRIVLKSKSCLTLRDNKLELTIPQGAKLSDFCAGMRRSVVVRVDGFGARGAALRKPAMKSHPVKGPRPYRGATKYPLFEQSFIPAGKITSLNDITNDNLFLFYGGGQEPPHNFGEALVHFMEKKNVTVEELAERTGLSPKTIQRMRNSSGGNYKLEAVIAVCIALHLEPYHSDMMIELAGYKLNCTARDAVYRLCIHYAYEQTVESCNNKLIELGQKPLTNLHD